MGKVLRAPSTETHSVPRAAQILDISDAMAWRLVSTGELRSIKIGRLRKVRQVDIDAYLNGLYQTA